MQHVVDLTNFSQEIIYGIDHNLFSEECSLTETDKKFIRYLVGFHAYILLEILELKQDFQPFCHEVIPFLVNKIADKILYVIKGQNDLGFYSSVNTMRIIQFICYSAVVSFSENADITDLDVMKLTLEVSFQLLQKTVQKTVCKHRWFSLNRFLHLT